MQINTDTYNTPQFIVVLEDNYFIEHVFAFSCNLSYNTRKRRQP